MEEVDLQLQRRYMSIGGWGEQPGNRFVSFVGAYARSGSEVGIGQNGCRHPLSFPFGSERPSYFFRVLCGSSECW